MADRRRDEERRLRGERRDPEWERRIEQRADRYRGSDERGYGDGERLGRDWEDRGYGERRRQHDYPPRYGHGPGIENMEEPRLGYGTSTTRREGEDHELGHGGYLGGGGGTYRAGSPMPAGRAPKGYRDEEYLRHRHEQDEREWYEQNRDRWSAQTYGGRMPDEDERYGVRAVGFGREAWSDEWQGPERAGRGWDMQERLHPRGRDVRQGPDRRGWNLREGLHRLGRSAREMLRGDDLEWTAHSRRVVGKAPKGYQRSDERIREDICERLMHSPYDASNVEISVNRGEVTLTGTVRQRAEKWGIEDLAEAVLGVNDVHNRIRVDRGEAQAIDPAAVTDTRGLHS
jgi:hypothetical protein